jgi:hypothetical protein
MNDKNSGSVNPVMLAAKQAFKEAQIELPGLNWKPEDEGKFMAGFARGITYLTAMQEKPTAEINEILKKWVNG